MITAVNVSWLHRMPRTVEYGPQRLTKLTKTRNLQPCNTFPRHGIIVQWVYASFDAAAAAVSCGNRRHRGVCAQMQSVHSLRKCFSIPDCKEQTTQQLGFNVQTDPCDVASHDMPMCVRVSSAKVITAARSCHMHIYGGKQLRPRHGSNGLELKAMLQRRFECPPRSRSPCLCSLRIVAERSARFAL